MKLFLDFLLEEKNESIPHLRHLAGESHFYGEQETDDELKRLEHLHKHLSGEQSNVESISMKADGSPSFNMGYVKDPSDGETKFGVAYKGAARGFAFSQDDVNKLFAHNEGLKSKMSQLLEHGSKIVRPYHGLIQGDFMGSKQDKTIRKEGNKIKFKENTIDYGIDKNSSEGKAINKAKIMVALHTRIDGENKEFNLHPNKFQHHDDVAVFNNKVYHNPENYTEEQKQDFEKNFSKAKEHLSQIRDHTSLVDGLTDHLQTYVNSTVREDTNPTVAGFRAHLKEKLSKQVDKLKSEKGRQKKTDEMNSNLFRVDENAKDFKHLFAAHTHLDKAKNILTDSLNSGEQHYEHEIKGEQTHPEGYVVKYKGGNSLDNVAKVVNRQEFSRKNFLDETFQFLR
jgi:hypothetical protein